MPEIIHFSVEGETVADIAWRYYGRTYEGIELVFSINPELTVLPNALPIGTRVRIEISEKVVQPAKETLDLWD